MAPDASRERVLVLAWALACVVLFIQGGEFAGPWQPVSLLFPVAVITVLAFALLARHARATRRRLPPLVVGSALFLLLWKAASFATDPSPQGALEVTATLVAMAAFAITAAVVATIEARSAWLLAIPMAALLPALLTIVEKVAVVSEDAAGIRVFSTLGNPNLLGAVLAPALVLALWAVLAREDTRQRAGWVLVGAVLLLALWSTGSRGPLVAVAFGMVTLRCVLPALLAPRTARLFVLGTLVALFGVAAWLSQNPRNLHGDGARVSGFVDAWRFAVDHPLTGVGVGRFGYTVRMLEDHPAPRVLHAHNLFLQQAAETGLPGLAGLLLFLGAVMASARSSWRAADRNERLFLAAAGAALVTMLVHNMVDYCLWCPPCGVLFWAVAGALVAPEVARSRAKPTRGGSN